MTALLHPPVDRSATSHRAPGRSGWRWTAILAVATAGALHIAAAAEHVGAGSLAVGFFLLTALAQLGMAGLLVVNGWAGSPPARELVALALTGTIALIVLYVVAETTSLLDAFAVPRDGPGAAHHAGGSAGSQIDPATGVVLADGRSVPSQGGVDMATAATSPDPAPGLLGTATVTVEVLAATALSTLLPASWRRRAVNALFALGGLIWALWFAGVLT